MIYSPTIVTVANTSKAGAKRTRLDVILGLIYQVDIFFPPGSAGLLHVAIYDGSYQLYPSDSASSFTGENTTVSFPDLYFKDTMPASLDILTWNLDDTYDHSVIVRIGLASKDEYQARFLGGLSQKAVSSLMTELQLTQETGRAGRLKTALGTIARVGE